jgi:hypothetical protein
MEIIGVRIGYTVQRESGISKRRDSKQLKSTAKAHDIKFKPETVQ